jgi:SAM-dependent methyltransferase
MSSPAHEGYDPGAFSEIVELEPRSWWFRSRNRLIAQTARRFVPAAGSVLEIGCGTGFTLGALHEALPAAQLTGTELFDEGLAVARTRWPDVRLLQADACELPFGDEEFDLVGAFDVLEHIEHDARAVGEAYRVLRPDGVLLVTVPQHAWLWSAADDYARHERRYSRRALVELMTGAGFQVERVTSFVTLLLPLMTASRAVSRLRRPAAEDFDPWAEFRIPRVVNLVFERLAGIEQVLIARGVSLPAGGSLLLVARKRAARQ